MSEGRFGIRAVVRSALAWLGLILMVVSLAWWEAMPKIEVAMAERKPPHPELFPVVVLDPGHGGQDSGAMCGNMLEKDLTLDVAQRVERLLQSQGLATVMTRVGDGYISLADRTSLINRVPDCIAVSIHFNEGNKPVSSGIETYYAEHQLIPGQPVTSWLPFLQRVVASGPNPESQSLAAFIQESLVTRTHAIDRGTKAQQFFVLANVRHPVVLIEGGFMTNKEDIARLANDNYREEIATAINDGILRYRKLWQDRQATFQQVASESTE